MWNSWSLFLNKISKDKADGKGEQAFVRNRNLKISKGDIMC